MESIPIKGHTAYNELRMGIAYNKIIVLGNSGSGKSTLAQKIGEKLSLPVHHLDFHFFSANWKQPDDEEWRQKITQFLSEDKWVIEGGVNNLESRVSACDLVIYLDFPLYFCLYRVIKRYFHFKKTETPFLPKGCDNKLTFHFLKYIFTFRSVRHPLIMETLMKYQGLRQTLILKTLQDIEDFEIIFLNNLIKKKNPLEEI